MKSYEIRQLIEQREQEWLSPKASKAAESRGRKIAEEPDSVRTCYQRDRDRILHSKAFRRLKHKTQVFIDPQGDHYRTRMTHSLEVAQVARTIGRALRLNEDLIEAIALGHDVGHTPFGHAGEQALDDALCERPESNKPQQFRHYEQSLRVLEFIEPLNLTYETLEGISGHSKGRSDLTSEDSDKMPSHEAAVVRISDRIAYLNHDLDDALRSGMIDEIPTALRSLGSTHGERIGVMVENAILTSLETDSISLSDEMLELLNFMKEWLFEEVYMRYPVVYPDIQKSKHVLRALFHYYCDHPSLEVQGVQGAVDYVAGMTDRFAILDYRRLFIPSVFRGGFEL
ncbi:MAG: deoxyguanosinetriphosphate triphosphohydrolase [Armatimonadetes bacterium]|nr:deoxyguanosinetriphosphate triphosphohydrolase [Armatimonadota bacterium]